MALIRADLIKESTLSKGTGNIVTIGAAIGSRPFSAVCSIGDTFYYSLRGFDLLGNPTSDFETGIGTYVAVNTIARTTVQTSSNGGGHISLASPAAQIAISLTAGDIAGVAAQVSAVSANLALPSGAAQIGFIQSGAGALAQSVQGVLRERVSLSQFGASHDVGGNQAASFSEALAQIGVVGTGVLPVPRGNWRLTDEVTLSDRYGLMGEQSVASILTLEGSGPYGIRIAGAGFGGSATDGIEVGRLNLQGGKDVALLGVQGTAMFRLHNLTAQNNSKGSIVRFTTSQDGALDDFDFLQCGGAGQPASDGAVVYYGPGCNNIYSRYGRFEAPRNTAIYIDGANAIRYIDGKIDGSAGGANLTTNPFVICKNGSITLSEYTVTGFKSYPLNVTGYGTLEFSGVVGNGLAPALFMATTLAYDRFVAEGGLPGVILKPGIKFRGTVGFSSTNTAANIIGAVISLVAPDPLMKPNTGNSGRVQVTGAFDTGGGLYQGAIKEWNGAAWASPSANDLYTGGWLIDSSTGNAFAQITTQAGGLCQFRLTGLTNTGNEHFIQYDSVHGVRLDIQIDAPAYSASRWTTRLAELKTSVTITGATYTAAGNGTGSGYTVVQLSAAVANDSLVGCFLYNKAADAYYYIAANSDSQLSVIHDRSAALVNATYDIVIGNPKAGAGIAINWQ